MFFYLFGGLMIFIITMLVFLYLKLQKKIKENKQLQQQHIAKIDIIRKEQSITLENIRIEMLKREDERNRQWFESEKEALHVLNGISIVLDLYDKMDKVGNEEILKKLDQIIEKING